MFRLRLRFYLFSLPVCTLLAWLDWRFVSHLNLVRTLLIWLISGGIFTSYIGSVRYLCQGNPWRSNLQLRFFMTHLVGLMAAVIMLAAPMLLLGFGLQHVFPQPQGWLNPVSLIMAVEVATLIYLPAVFLNYFIELTRRTQQLERERLQAEAARAQSALDGLKSAIHPHFLFNILNMLVPEIHRDPEKAVELVDDLSSFLVLSLKMTEKRWVSAGEEFRHARLFLDMEMRRFGDRLSCDWQVHLEHSGEILVPPLIILPLLENAVKHGVANGSEPARLELSCVLDGAWLDLRVANSIGNDPDDEARTTGLGLGLSNLRERLDLYYQGGFSMRSQRLPDRYWVHLRLPATAAGR